MCATHFSRGDPVGRLSRFEVRPDPLDIDNLHIEIEATRLAYAARDALLSDPAKAEVPIAYLLSDRLADALAAKIDPCLSG